MFVQLMASPGPDWWHGMVIADAVVGLIEAVAVLGIVCIAIALIGWAMVKLCWPER